MDLSNVCAPPAPAAPCRSPERTERCGKQKFEPQNKTQLICSTKTCQIFGGHDTEPMPDYPCPARRIKAKDPNKNSLGSPVGMVASNVNFKTEGKPSDISMARYATYLKAFARLYLNPETMWTSTLLDDLMREGLALYSASEKEENKLDSPSDIYTESEKRIQRQFEMSGCKFQVELMRKFKLNTSAEAGADGDGRTNVELSLQDLKRALKKFFLQHKYCLLAMGAVYTMIWHKRGVFFVLDVCGRRLTDFYADRDKGVAMLVCLKTLENVRHMLMGLVNLGKVDSCTLRELKLVKVVMPSGGVLQRDYGMRVHQYEIINDDYAYLKASLHLTLNKSDLFRNRSALPAGVVAIVVSKIDHPATWNMKIVDKILCFGVSFCQACWTKCITTEPIVVQEFPSLFDMGQFRVNIELVPCKYEGIWHCVPGYNYSELAQAIGKAFEGGDQKLLLQINYQMYAIWQKQGFIYLFDPYRHRILGNAGDSEIYEEMEKSATVRMFRSFEVFMNAFNHILLDSNRTSKFCIHLLKIKNIQFRQKKAGEETLLNEIEDGEVKSLNEHVCFEESDDLCLKALGDISDYEDEDLRSDVDELELRTSSSEEEEVLEEEEAGGGGGEEEELEGLESSSSEDESKAKGKGNKADKKGGGKKKGKGGNKGGKGAKGGKNSKGASDSNNRKKAGENTDDNDLNKKGTGDDENKMGNKDKLDEGKKNKTEDAEAKKKLTGDKDGKDGKDGKDVKKDEAKKITGDAVDTSKKEDKFGKEGKTNVNEKKLEEPIQNIKDKDKTKDMVKDITKDITKDMTKDITKDLTKDKETPPLKQDMDKDKGTILTEKNKPPTNTEKFTLPQEQPKQQRRHTCQKDGTEADDENEDDFFKKIKRFCTAPNHTRYPGYFKRPVDMAVVGSENGSYDSLCKLLHAGFRRADRILAMTPWGNFVVFRCMCGGQYKEDQRQYYVFDGCTCNVNRFRHLDLTIGTAGLLCFQHLHDIIEYMRHIRRIRSKENKRRCECLTADEICREYCR